MYLFDTYALIEIARGNPSYALYDRYPINISILNIGELYLYHLRNHGHQVAKAQISLLGYHEVIITHDTMLEAAAFKQSHRKKRLSWADCVGYISAKRNKLKFLTGDIQFKGLPNVEFVK